MRQQPHCVLLPTQGFFVHYSLIHLIFPVIRPITNHEVDEGAASHQ